MRRGSIYRVESRLPAGHTGCSTGVGGAPRGPDVGGLLHLPFILFLSSLTLHAHLYGWWTRKGGTPSFPDTTEKWPHFCKGLVRDGFSDLPTITLLLPRASCPAGIASSCVSWPSRIPIGSGRAGLMTPEAGGPGTRWGGGWGGWGGGEGGEGRWVLVWVGGQGR